MVPTKKKSKTCSLEISGLKNATITIYPPLDAILNGIVEVGIRKDESRRADESANFTMLDICYKATDKCIVIKDITGELEVSW